jgi:hypothetical protein
LLTSILYQLGFSLFIPLTIVNEITSLWSTRPYSLIQPSKIFLPASPFSNPRKITKGIFGNTAKPGSSS